MTQAGETTTQVKFSENQMNLTPEQEQQIAAEALREYGAHSKKEAEDEDPEPSKGGSDDESDGEGKVKEDTKTGDDNGLSGKDEEAGQKGEEEVKAAEEKAAAEKAEAEKSEKEAQEKRQEMIKAFAEKENISIEDAEEELSKNEAIVKKFGDPLALAKELRKYQSEASKARAEAEKIKKSASEPKLNDFVSVKNHIDHQLKTKRDELINLYREEYPGLSASLDDDAIVDMMRKEATEKMMIRVESARIEKLSAAREKRAELISKFPESAKQFLPEVKAILEKTPDEIITSDDYDINDVIHWARGKNFEKAMKEAEERGYKRGKEEAKIISEKVPVKVDGGKKASAPTKDNFEAKLTKYEREEALNKFDGVPMTDEEKYKTYFEIYKKK